MVEVRTDFITLEELKTSLGISQDNIKNNNQLLDVIESANSEVDARIKPYLGSAPMDTGNDVYYQAKKATLRYSRSLWYERTGQLDRAKQSDEIYETKMNALIAAIVADKPDRTKAVFITDDNPLNQVYQPNNIDEYIVREF